MNRNRMENDRDPGIWNRNGRDDQQQSMIIILRNKRVIDKIKTETAVMKRVLSTVDSWCEIAEFITFTLQYSLSLSFGFNIYWYSSNLFPNSQCLSVIV
eukprot:UN4060